jgi:hypothetical protein
VGGAELVSCEGTTQGDPLAMPLYALSLIPFIHRLHGLCKQAWYADDAQAAGQLQDLRTWWDLLVSNGPAYGYYVNPGKTKLVVKSSLLDEALVIFEGTGITITEGSRDLGSAIGSASFVAKYAADKVTDWTKEMETLAMIAKVSPQAAHSAFVHGTRHRWAFLQRTLPTNAEVFQPLETVIRQQFIPAILGDQQVGDDLRDLLSVSAQNGGLAIDNPVRASDEHYQASSVLCDSLVQCIIEQDPGLRFNKERQQEIKRNNKAIKLKKERKMVADLRSRMSPDQIRAFEASQEKGASALVSTLPLQQYGFSLSKSDFTDSLCMRYRLPLTGLPSTCLCGAAYSVDHSQSCHVGGFINKRHDEVRDIIAKELSQVLHDVQVEPHLKPLSPMEVLSHPSAITDDTARSDIRARGFWSDQQEAFFDIRVFYPNATSYLSRDLGSLYCSMEKQKKNQYNERIINVERGCFTPLVFSTFGGMGREAKTMVKRLGAMLAEKKKESYSRVVCLLRTRLSFALCRSAGVCLRGTRRRRSLGASTFPPTDVINFQSSI